MKLHLDTPKLEQEREGRSRQKSEKREKYMVALSRPTCARVPAPTRYGWPDGHRALQQAILQGLKRFNWPEAQG